MKRALQFSLVFIIGLLAACNTASEPIIELDMTLEPTTVTLSPLETYTFTATLTGADDPAITWTVTGGTLESSGATVIYTAPADAGVYTLTASSVQDPACSASATITVQSDDVQPNPVAGDLGKLLAGDGAAGDRFGHSVAVAGDTLVVGAPTHDGPADDAGAAYVFTRGEDGWQEQQRLTMSNPETDERFGFAVDVSGDTLTVGNLAEPRSTVTLYTDQAGTWTEVQTLTGPANQDNFGRALVLEGDTWNQQQRLTASDGGPFERFGYDLSVSADGMAALVGAHGAEGLGPLTGSAYVFSKEGDTWSEQQTLETLPFTEGDYFAHAVAATPDTLFVAANRDDYSDKDSGSVHVFAQAEDWTRHTQLNADVPTENQGFGHALAATQDTLVVGTLSEPGTVHVFREEGNVWTEHAAHSAPGAAFGQAVDLSGQILAIGAPHDAERGEGAGAVYVTEQTP